MVRHKAPPPRADLFSGTPNDPSPDMKTLSSQEREAFTDRVMHDIRQRYERETQPMIRAAAEARRTKR